MKWQKESVEINVALCRIVIVPGLLDIRAQNLQIKAFALLMEPVEVSQGK